MSRRPIPFVVASTPRSGTGYTAQLLRLLGVPCGHEKYFNRDAQTYYVSRGEGCASWLSVPFLEKLPPETVVLHQVRDPVRTINALIRTHNMRNGIGPNMSFLLKHYSPRGSLPEAGFWYAWHRRIDEYAHLTYRVEDIPIEEILDALNRKCSLTAIRVAYASVARNFNTYGPVPKYTRWNDLPPNIRKLASIYGYNGTESQ